MNHSVYIDFDLLVLEITFQDLFNCFSTTELKKHYLSSWSLTFKSMTITYIIEIEFTKPKIDNNFSYSCGLNYKIMIDLGNNKLFIY